MLTLAFAQLNPVLGDLSGNRAKLVGAWLQAEEGKADLLLTSELYLCGYPPEDLVLKPGFQQAVWHEVQVLQKLSENMRAALAVGAPIVRDGKLYNALLVIEHGEIKFEILKHDLPNYGPFDEKRVFASGGLPKVTPFRGHKLGFMICEDMWFPDTARHLAEQGAEILLVPNGSPYERGKWQQRCELAKDRVMETGLSIVYVNQVGGQDELVFDGSSFALNARGEGVISVTPWHEAIFTLNLPVTAPATALIAPSHDNATYNALMLGLRDYVNKNGFRDVVLGLSGGIDSALVAAIAVDALGPERVRGVRMPSPYTSAESMVDAEDLAHNLGIQLDTVPIAEVMQAFGTTLTPIFAGRGPDITEENIQARIRGMILMGISNKCGPMVLSTGNKSEMSVGYSTLYGDLCGGFAVIKDVYKTEVYTLARWRNATKPEGALGPAKQVIPTSTLTRAPTAELRPNQTDQDNLPPYEVLDDILQGLIERDEDIPDIVGRGHALALVQRVWALLNRAEYKRRQAPPGVKISRRLMGRDRRYPITNKYNGRV